MYFDLLFKSCDQLQYTYSPPNSVCSFGLAAISTHLCPRCCEQQTVPIVCLANALTSSLWMDSTKKDIEILRWAQSPMCLPSVYLMSTARDQISQAIKYWLWEWPGIEASNLVASYEGPHAECRKGSGDTWQNSHMC